MTPTNRKAREAFEVHWQFAPRIIAEHLCDHYADPATIAIGTVCSSWLAHGWPVLAVIVGDQTWYWDKYLAELTASNLGSAAAIA
jgi:hypothetical protein